MKPFNLERAIAGDPVCTRTGEPVKIAGYNPDAPYQYRIAGWLPNGELHSWYDHGTYTNSGTRPELDLFMETIKRKLIGWVNWYPDGSCYAWSTKEKAESNKFPDRIACVEVTVNIEE